MSDTLKFDLKLDLVSIEMTCGHIIYVTEIFLKNRLHDHRPFWCSACGASNEYKAKKEAPPPEPKKKPFRLLRFSKDK